MFYDFVYDKVNKPTNDNAIYFNTDNSKINSVAQGKDNTSWHNCSTLISSFISCDSHVNNQQNIFKSYFKNLLIR